LLIDLSWNSSRLEGNTYSLLDTRRLIEFGEETQGSSHLDAQMILNHKDAIAFLVSAADDIAYNRYTILNLHGILANNLLPDQAAAGRLRRMAVGIAQSSFHPLEMPQLIEECFDQILATASAIQDPFEQAFFAMVHLPYLQPFDDVNNACRVWQQIFPSSERTSRRYRSSTFLVRPTRKRCSASTNWTGPTSYETSSCGHMNDLQNDTPRYGNLWESPTPFVKRITTSCDNSSETSFEGL
jgi:hypothetical protein